MPIRFPSAPRVAVVGAGWSGSAVARELHDSGLRVDVYEACTTVGGHCRSEVLNGVVYEPHGAHIFHTSKPDVAAFVQRFGMQRRYAHRVLAEVYLTDDDEAPTLLSWPPQLHELEALTLWPRIERELNALPAAPGGASFESFVMSLMGETLYGLFIRDYTTKQWGMHPSLLSSSVAPKRVELRRDGYQRLFRDRWEYFPPRGMNAVIESILAPVSVTCGAPMRLQEVAELNADAVVITAPLDELIGEPGCLGWRGITMRSTYVPTEGLVDTVTPGYVVNQPSARVPYTRTVETKHASGQRVHGTVVSQEFSGAPGRHYPVPTVERTYERRNDELKRRIVDALEMPVFFCGRLANYAYINQDEAIEQALACAAGVREVLRGTPALGRAVA